MKNITFCRWSLIILVMLVGARLVSADWTAPLTTPPTCTAGNPGCDTPINVSDGAQIKTGKLGIGATATAGDLGNSIGSLFIKNSDSGKAAVDGWQTNAGIGVKGEGGLYGVYGINNSPTGASVVAQQDTVSGFGFYQASPVAATGATVKNYFQGLLGIGTNAPSQLLEVKGTGANIKIWGNTNSSTKGYLTQANTATYLTHNASFNGTGVQFVPDSTTVGASQIQLDRGFIAFNQAAPTLATPISWTEVMRVAAGGNVGIGTASPATKLDVNGNVQALGFKIATGAGAGKVLTSDASGLGTWAAPSGGLPTGTASQTLRNDGTNWVANSVLSNDGTNVNVGSGALVAGLANEIWTQPQTNSAATLYINNRGYNNGITQYRNTQVGNGTGGLIAYFRGSDGSVGIGNNSPGGKLDVSGTIKSTISDAATGLGANQTQVGLNLQNTDSTANNWSLIQSRSINNIIDSAIGFQHVTPGSNYADIAFATRGAGGWGERLRINNAGNVGIGTASPAAKLDVAGTVKIADGSQGVGKVLTSDASGLASWQAVSGGLWTTSGNNIYNNNTGYVGVGTNAPSTRLEVNGNTKTTGLYVQNGSWTSNGNDILLNAGTSGQTVYLRPNGAGSLFGQVSASAAGVTDFKDSAGNTQVILNNGNVGIGTNSPNAKLHISGGNALVYGPSNQYVEVGADGNNAVNLRWMNSGGYGKIQTYSGGAAGGNLSLQTGAGNVGIGNSSPAAKLDVTGTVKIADGSQGAGRVLTSDANGLASWGSVSGSSLNIWDTTHVTGNSYQQVTCTNGRVLNCSCRCPNASEIPNVTQPRLTECGTFSGPSVCGGKCINSFNPSIESVEVFATCLGN